MVQVLFAPALQAAAGDEEGLSASGGITGEPGLEGDNEQAPVPYEPPPDEEFVLEDAGLPTRELSLEESLALSVTNNLDVEVERYTPLIAEQTMQGSWGAYDPVLSGDVGYEKEEIPNTFLSVINAGQRKLQTKTVDGGVGLETLLPYLGATVGARLDSGRTRTNSNIQALSPQYDSQFFLTARVPLMKGLIWNRPWTDVKITKISYGSSLDEFRLQVMNIIESTIQDYWQFVADQEQYKVASKSLETARALLDQTQTQYDVGVVSKVEVVEAEAGVAAREFDLIVAKNNFANSQDALIDAVLGRQLQGRMDFRVRTTDDPEDYEIRPVDVNRSIRVAFENLPELSKADKDIEEREIELKFSKNQRLPQFDVDARYGFLNSSGSPGQGNYPNSYDDFYEDEGNENYSVRGLVSIPIPNTSARRAVERSRLDLRRAKTQRMRTEQDVILTVRSAARGILASAEGIEAAERRRLAAQEQLRAERIRLEHGESTPFEVLQRESDLVDAESEKIRALKAYRDADARLERAQGTILDTYHIQLSDMREPTMR